MKRFVLLTLVLAMVLSMAGCGCDHQWAEATCTAPKTCTRCGETEGAALTHTSGELKVVSVDTENLTITHELSCARCGEVLETQESSTGIAPAEGTMQLTPDEWYACLSTNIQLMGAGQTLIPYATESEDDALVHAVVSVSGMLAAISFWDAEGNVLTTEAREARNKTHSIRVDGQFTNDTAPHFFMFLMLAAITNNAQLTFEDANNLCAQIMSGNPVSDNGYTYAMEIVSAEEHTVCVSITAE